MLYTVEGHVCMEKLHSLNSCSSGHTAAARGVWLRCRCTRLHGGQAHSGGKLQPSDGWHQLQLCCSV